MDALNRKMLEDFKKELIKLRNDASARDVTVPTFAKISYVFLFVETLTVFFQAVFFQVF